MLSNFRRIFSENSARIRSTSNRRPTLRTPLRAARNRASPAVRPRRCLGFAPRSCRARSPSSFSSRSFVPKHFGPRRRRSFSQCPRGPNSVRRIGGSVKTYRRSRQPVSSAEPQAFVTTGRITDAMCARTPAAMADSSGLNMSEWLFGAFTTPSGSVPRNM